MDSLRIFVGTDQWQRDAGAERVLEHSIRKHATCPVDITWMRSGDPGWEVSKLGTDGSWRINIEPGFAWKQRGAWGTSFSGFRFAIPEVCGFDGRAVYFDADMLVLGDVRELLETPLRCGYRTISLPRTDVSVIDCGFFKDAQWWPTIAQMKPSGWITWHYCQLLQKHGAISPTLDAAWNVCDPMQPCRDRGVGGCKLLHYTVVPTQPYKPYPTVRYSPHPWKSWVDTWNAYDAEARTLEATR